MNVKKQEKEFTITYKINYETKSIKQERIH